MGTLYRAFPWKAPDGSALAGVEVTAWTAWPVLAEVTAADGVASCERSAWELAPALRPEWADWEPGSDSGGPNLFLDASDDQRYWLERHLIPADQDPLPADVVALMRRDLDATFDVESIDSICLHLGNDPESTETDRLLAQALAKGLRARAARLQAAVEAATKGGAE